MPYYPTQEQLIEDCRTFLDLDPRFFDQDVGCFTWWGRVVEFFKTNDEITLEYEGERITFSRP
ncbi:hypothetical protein [Sphingomonas aerophila]|uniref:Uncharacterized protein n=1 Tax=Sphingomonas aerophila TaxID=1344948 RepID=A0A7W9EV45_9SPHN|nr:hypothetical protein [Sphingomonas aerophila]MBB5715866.1 hypothetical protein [Sphingomonas aerophila]